MCCPPLRALLSAEVAVAVPSTPLSVTTLQRAVPFFSLLIYKKGLRDQSSFLHHLLHELSHPRGTLGHRHAGTLQRRNLVAGCPLSSTDDRPGMPHAPPRRRRQPGNKAHNLANKRTNQRARCVVSDQSYEPSPLPFPFPRAHPRVEHQTTSDNIRQHQTTSDNVPACLPHNFE